MNKDWKDIYGPMWEAGGKREKYVRDLILKEFPELEIRLGYGAESTNKIPYDPNHKRGAPDLFCYLNDILLFQVEVTGTDREVTDYIWIRPDKLKQAQRDREEGQITWIYTVYGLPFGDCDYVLDIDLVEKHRNNIKEYNGSGRKELFIKIPCHKALPRIYFKLWLRALRKRHGLIFARECTI